MTLHLLYFDNGLRYDQNDEFLVGVYSSSEACQSAIERYRAASTQNAFYVSNSGKFSQRQVELDDDFGLADFDRDSASQKNRESA